MFSSRPPRPNTPSLTGIRNKVRGDSHMTRRGYNPHDAPPPKRTERAKPGPIPTLGQLREGTCWFWTYCNRCGRGAPAALAPYIIRWGADASSDLMRRSFRCSSCGGKGVTLIRPSWQDSHVGLSPFPVERMQNRRSQIRDAAIEWELSAPPADLIHFDQQNSKRRPIASTAQCLECTYLMRSRPVSNRHRADVGPLQKTRHLDVTKPVSHANL